MNTYEYPNPILPGRVSAIVAVVGALLIALAVAFATSDTSASQTRTPGASASHPAALHGGRLAIQSR
jgi:hypothetical protein